MKQVVAAVIVSDDKILICQRMADQSMPYKWEFPGGKIEPNEQPRDALRRELQEELGITAKIGVKVASVCHSYGNGAAVELEFYLVEEFEGEIQNRIFHDIQWVRREELPTYDFLEADIALIKRLATGEINLAPRARARHKSR